MYLPSYFRYIGNKTFIDRYPKDIIDVSILKDGVLVELGGGVGNDMLVLVSKLGAKAENLYFIENDPNIFEKAKERLEKHFNGFKNHILDCDVRRCPLPDNFADYVYANNLFLCLGSKENVIHTMKEASRILKKDGVLFGRTLSNKINEVNLKNLSTKKRLSEEEKFLRDTVYWLKEGLLVGLTREDLESYAKIAGFRKVSIARIPSINIEPKEDFYFRISK